VKRGNRKLTPFDWIIAVAIIGLVTAVLVSTLTGCATHAPQPLPWPAEAVVNAAPVNYYYIAYLRPTTNQAVFKWAIAATTNSMATRRGLVRVMDDIMLQENCAGVTLLYWREVE